MNNQKSNDTASQRKRILDYLRSKPITTIAARVDLDIMHPSARVQELKGDGHNIVTHFEVVMTGKNKHRVAKYVLLSGGSDD